MRVVSKALDYAAGLIAARAGLALVAREPLGAEEAEAEPGAEVGVVAALSEGEAQEVGFLMGAPTPFEFEHGAHLELLVVGGSAEARRARRDSALLEASAAIEADPTLGGLVDWAELERPDLSTNERDAAAMATLALHYTAPTALG